MLILSENFKKIEVFFFKVPSLARSVPKPPLIAPRCRLPQTAVKEQSDWSSTPELPAVNRQGSTPVNIIVDTRVVAEHHRKGSTPVKLM